MKCISVPYAYFFKHVVTMQILLILLVVLGGMGLSVEGGLLGPLGGEVGHLWATFTIFGFGAALAFLLVLFFSPRNSPSYFAQPGWQLTAWSRLCCYFNSCISYYWPRYDNDRYSCRSNF